MKRYFLLLGFRDGWRGLFLAVYHAFYSFLNHTKLYEIQLLKLKRSPE